MPSPTDSCYTTPMPRGVPKAGFRRPPARPPVRRGQTRREAFRPLWPTEPRPRWELVLSTIAERHHLGGARLLGATLLQALRDITTGGDGYDALDALSWIESDARDDIVRFSTICDVLDLPINDIRAAARRWFILRWVLPGAPTATAHRAGGATPPALPHLVP